MLEMRDVSRTVDGEVHLADISFTFEAGRFYTILGRTGAGKTSLMRALMGLMPLDRGQVLLDGTDITAVPVWERMMAMVYQQFINYPHLNVLDNVAFPLRRQGVGKAEARNRAREFIELVGLGDLVDRRPAQLSGGQQQRVALARALAKEARTLMLDEPLVNLDYKLREQLREQFPKIIERNRDSIILYATTEPREAMQLGDEIIVMHEGRIIDAGKPDEMFLRPRNIIVAELMGEPPISSFRGEVRDGAVHLAGGLWIEGAGRTLPEPGEYLIGIRPEDVHVGGTLAARVSMSEISGSETITHLILPFGDLLMLSQGVSIHEPDDRMNIGFAAADLYFFDLDGNLVSAPDREARD